MISREIKQLLLVTGLLLLKIALLIAFFVWLTGCANTQYAEQIKRDMAKPKEDKTVIEKTTVSKEQREWSENNTYYKEVMVCTKFEKEVSKDGITSHQTEQLTKYKSLFDTGIINKEMYMDEVRRIMD